MAVLTYSPTKAYLPYRKKSKKGGCGCGGKKHDHPEGCDCEECKCSCKEEKCGCCPPGLVAVNDENGKHIACLIPNDAELYEKNTFRCPDGYIKVIKTSDGSFYGCVTEENFGAIYDKVNP